MSANNLLWQVYYVSRCLGLSNCHTFFSQFICLYCSSFSSTNRQEVGQEEINSHDPESEDGYEYECEENNDVEADENEDTLNENINGKLRDTKNDILYECYAISNHSGTLNGGHYTAYCRHPFNHTEKNTSLFNCEDEQTAHAKDMWHLYNDRAVSQASSDNVITGDAYLLFFEKQ